ncbi:MAG TPA: hypothetical protein PK230_07175, partial [Chitinophagales bacterium]|nr:hypothetical protein [Chitinophagales bacterium]
NGNLKTLNRNALNKQNAVVPMDKFSYDYTPLTNKLTLVKDSDTNNDSQQKSRFVDSAFDGHLFGTRHFDANVLLEARVAQSRVAGSGE